MFDSLSRLLASHAALFFTLGLMPLFEALVTIEWSRPYCLNPADGPAFAATGMPFPYERFSGISSMEFFFMPHVYLLNIGILCLCAFPLVRYLLNSVVGFTRSSRRVAVGGVGLVLFLVSAALVILQVYAGLLRPVGSIGDSSYGRYAEFRPVSIRWGSRASDCTPSRFWFPNGWHGQ